MIVASTISERTRSCNERIRTSHSARHETCFFIFFSLSSSCCVRSESNHLNADSISQSGWNNEGIQGAISSFGDLALCSASLRQPYCDILLLPYTKQIEVKFYTGQ
uniref:(northern house mosquito) hypothetical protein n=1 Tax=Culex pipiens TaxID=7175 RepID=A0A8D8NV50_CULPI